MLNKYRDEHFDRIIDSTNQLYHKRGTICHKCHSVQGPLNCIFCYCPLYEDPDCGGNYTILNNGLKDCNKCLKPHTKDFIKEQLSKLYQQ